MLRALILAAGSVQCHTPKPDSSPDEKSNNREQRGPANLAVLGG